MRHAGSRCPSAERAAALDDLLERRDHRLGAVEAEALVPVNLTSQTFLEAFRLDRCEDRALALAREVISLSGPSMRSCSQAFWAASEMCMNSMPSVWSRCAAGRDDPRAANRHRPSTFSEHVLARGRFAARDRRAPAAHPTARALASSSCTFPMPPRGLAAWSASKSPTRDHLPRARASARSSQAGRGGKASRNSARQFTGTKRFGLDGARR